MYFFPADFRYPMRRPFRLTALNKGSLVALFVLGFVTSVQAANQSLQSGSGTVPIPQGAPWTDVGHWRTEVRVHNWSVTGSEQWIFGTKEYSVRIDGVGNVGLTDWVDNGTLGCQLPAVGYTDFIVRVAARSG